MSNLTLWDAMRTVPENAKKAIGGGRLKGKTDINPMWRIKTLTENFGICGVGWKYVITRQWTEIHEKKIAAFTNIDLFIKHNGEWSDAIPGTGGSMFVEQESGGAHVSDECFKMSLTDAISVSCKALGIGANVYWEADANKYNNLREDEKTEAKKNKTSIPGTPGNPITEPRQPYDGDSPRELDAPPKPPSQKEILLRLLQEKGIDAEAHGTDIAALCKVHSLGRTVKAGELTTEQFQKVLSEISKWK